MNLDGGPDHLARQRVSLFHFRTLLVFSVSLCLCASVVYFFFWIFAQVSRSVTARLNASFPGAESLSTQKYPSRSNWNLSPTFAVLRLGSSFAPFNTMSESGLRFAR